MTIYLALFRGINVGGHHIIKMAELKSLLETMGLENIKTYIQSGNVLFESDETEVVLRNRIEEEVEKRFGFPITIVLRNSLQLDKVIKQCPYAVDQLQEGESVHVAFLPEPPLAEAIDRLHTFENDDEKFQIVGKEIYLYFRKSIRDSKLAVQIQKIGVPATVRNWKTTSRLVAMAKAMNNS